MRISLVLATAAMALPALACSDPLATPEPDLALSLTGDAAALEGVSGMEVVVGGRRFVLEPSGAGSSRDVQAPRVGFLRVDVALLDDAEETVATTAFDMNFADESDHWVNGRVGLARPTGMCIGQLVVLPLAGTAGGGAPADTLFVTYGSIPKDAVC